MNDIKIRLPAWLTDGMVFQHGVPLVLFGYYMKGIPIRLEILRRPTDGRKVSKLDTDYGRIHVSEIRADDTGRFIFELPPYKPSNDDYTFLFMAAGMRVQISNLRCGDVWFLFGSSLFSLPLSRSGAPKTPLQDRALGLIRFFVIDHNVYNELPEARDEKENNTENNHKENVTQEGDKGDKEESISDKNLITNNIQKIVQPAQPEEKAQDKKKAKSIILRGKWITAKDQLPLANVSAAAFSLAYHLADQLHYPVGIVDLAEENTGTLNWIRPEIIRSDLEVMTFLKNTPLKHPYKPVFYKVLTSFTSMNIRGIVFSPDDHDILLTDIYLDLLTHLLETVASILGPKRIADKSHIPSLILLQLRPKYKKLPDHYQYVHFNEVLAVSRRVLKIPTGVLSQHDMLLSEKTDAFYVGRRLALIALGQHFTSKMPTSSPECIDVEIIGNKILLTFDNSGDGLKLADYETKLRGFCICDRDRVYRPAQAKILHGVRVMVWHEDISDPVGVTYAYYPMPHRSTFKSKSDIPVLPFRLDREDAVYSPDLFFASCDALSIYAVDKDGDPVTELNLYEIRKGSALMQLDLLNKTEGSASLSFSYDTDEGVFSFAPILRYATMYTPLDLRVFTGIEIDVFNPDEREKTLQVSGFSGSATIARGLRWQRLKLDTENEMMIEDLEFIIEDQMRSGSIYIDNIQFVYNSEIDEDDG